METKSVKTFRVRKQKNGKRKVTWREDFIKNGALYLVAVPSFLYFFVLHYIPMFGIVMAFQDFRIRDGFFRSEWIGLDNFRSLFTGTAFPTALRNTAAMGFLNLTLVFIMPVIFAFLISEIRNKKGKRTMQTISYMPYFIAPVVVAELIKQFVGYNGAVTEILTAIGFERQNWLANADIPVFWLINSFAEIWQNIGFSSIMIVAAISMVGKDYHEAAVIDGASRWKRITKITFPLILPTIVLLFTLRMGLVLIAGFDKILLLYMPITYETSDVLLTYTYRMAFGSEMPNYALGAASGLFQSIVGTILLIVSNRLSRKVTEQSVF